MFKKYWECSGNGVLGSFLVIYIFTSLFSQRGQTLQSSFLSCLSRMDISLQLSALRVHQKKTTTQFFILLNCCLYIYILNSSFNASCNNFLTFISFFFYKRYNIFKGRANGWDIIHPFRKYQILLTLWVAALSVFSPEDILKYRSCINFFQLLLFIPTQ